MDPVLVETVATIILALAGGAVTYIHTQLSKIWESHDKLEEEFRSHTAALNERFVAKDDYRVDMVEIKEMMREMRYDVKAILGVPPAP